MPEHPAQNGRAERLIGRVKSQVRALLWYVASRCKWKACSGLPCPGWDMIPSAKPMVPFSSFVRFRARGWRDSTWGPKSVEGRLVAPCSDISKGYIVRVMDGDTPRLYATTLVYQDFLPAVESPAGEASGAPADAVFPTRVEMGKPIPSGSEEVQIAPEVSAPRPARATTEVSAPAPAHAATEVSAPAPAHAATEVSAPAPAHAATEVFEHAPVYAAVPDTSTARRRIIGKTSVFSGIMRGLSGHDLSCSLRAPTTSSLEVWPSSCREGMRAPPLTMPSSQLSELENVQLRAYLMVKGGYHLQATERAASILCTWLQLQGCGEVSFDAVSTVKPEQSGVQQLVRAMFEAVGVTDIQPPVRVLVGSAPAGPVDCTSGEFPGISFVFLPVRLPSSGGEVWCPLQQIDTVQGDCVCVPCAGQYGTGSTFSHGAAGSIPCPAWILVSVVWRPGGAVLGGRCDGYGWFCAVRAGGVASYSVIASRPLSLHPGLGESHPISSLHPGLLSLHPCLSNLSSPVTGVHSGPVNPLSPAEPVHSDPTHLAQVQVMQPAFPDNGEQGKPEVRIVEGTKIVESQLQQGGLAMNYHQEQESQRWYSTIPLPCVEPIDPLQRQHMPENYNPEMRNWPSYPEQIWLR